MSNGFCHEYACGCIIHHLAGTIRKCDGVGNRSMSGRPVPKPEGAEKRHNDAMNDDAIRTYDVADILP